MRNGLVLMRWLLAAARFFRAGIILSLFGGTIGAITGRVPWWWGLACAGGCLLACVASLRLARFLYEGSTGPDERAVASDAVLQREVAAIASEVLAHLQVGDRAGAEAVARMADFDWRARRPDLAPLLYFSVQEAIDGTGADFNLPPPPELRARSSAR